MKAVLCRPIAPAILAAVATGLLLAGCAEKITPTPIPATLKHSNCGDLTIGGFPQPKKQKSPPYYFVCHPGAYAILYDPQSRTAVWTVEFLDGDRFKNPTKPHAIDYRPSPYILPDHNARAEMYGSAKEAGYSMTTLAPAADFPQNPVKMSWTYYLTNTVPQRTYNANGIWKVLELNIRKWAIMYDGVYVISGTIYTGGKSTLPRETRTPSEKPERNNFVVPARRGTNNEKAHILIPDYLYKVIVDRETQQGVAFAIPNKPTSAKDLPIYLTSIYKVEQATGTLFFPALPWREKLLYTVAPDLWEITTHTD